MARSYGRGFRAVQALTGPFTPEPTSTPIQDLINGLTADGVFAKLDRLWVFAQATEALALVDLVASATATNVNSTPFTTNVGYTGQDAFVPTSYIDSNYKDNTGPNYTQNLAHYSGWCVANVASVNGGALLGIEPATQLYDTFFSDGNLYARINDNPQSGAQGVPGTRQGHWVVNRTGAAASGLYRNGSLFSSPNGTSTGAAGLNFFLTCDNSAGSAAGGNPNQLAMASMGGSLSATDITNFYNRLRTYMTAVGVP